MEILASLYGWVVGSPDSQPWKVWPETPADPNMVYVGKAWQNTSSLTSHIPNGPTRNPCACFPKSSQSTGIADKSLFDFRSRQMIPQSASDVLHSGSIYWQHFTLTSIALLITRGFIGIWLLSRLFISLFTCWSPGFFLSKSSSFPVYFKVIYMQSCLLGCFFSFTFSRNSLCLPSGLQPDA